MTLNPIPRFLMASLAALFLMGCSGEDDSGGGNGAPTFSAENEAKRLAGLVRGIRDIGSLVFPYVRSQPDLLATDGTTVNCLNGGSVSRVYRPGPSAGQPDIEQTLSVSFNDCREALGLIDGEIVFKWDDGDYNANTGVFKPNWSGVFTVDGNTYAVDNPSSTLTTFNSNSGLQTSRISVRSLSGLMPVSGPGVAVASLFATFKYTNGDSTLIVNEADGQYRESGAAASLDELSPATYTRVQSSTAILGIGTVVSAQYKLNRTNRTGLRESVFSTSTTQNGLLNITSEGSSRTTLAGQFAWANLIQTPIYDPDGF